MDIKWRPPNWAKIKLKHCRCASKDCKHCPTNINVCSFGFEAGADAILDVLFKLAEESPTGTFEIDSRIQRIYYAEEKDNVSKQPI